MGKTGHTRTWKSLCRTEVNCRTDNGSTRALPKQTGADVQKACSRGQGQRDSDIGWFWKGPQYPRTKKQQYPHKPWKNNLSITYVLHFSYPFFVTTPESCSVETPNHCHKYWGKQNNKVSLKPQAMALAIWCAQQALEIEPRTRTSYMLQPVRKTAKKCIDIISSSRKYGQVGANRSEPSNQTRSAPDRHQLDSKKNTELLTKYSRTASPMSSNTLKRSASRTESKR